MASKKAISLVLSIMHEAYPNREITEATGPVWLELFADVGDEALVAAVKKCCVEPGRSFFPGAGDVRKYLTKPIELPDVPKTLRQISKLGQYHPARSWIDPRVETVREKLGDAIANAYASIGPVRLYSENDTTRDIAERDFGALLTEELRTESLQIAAPSQPKKLNPGVPVGD